MGGDPVVVVGAGLSGLACARRLAAAGRPVLVLEGSDGVGGRVRTDRAEGFLLDRGFQVLLTAYPEARAVLDYRGLALRPFHPGALVRAGGRFHRVVDPWRRPWQALRSALSPVGSLGDKLKVARLRAESRQGPSPGPEASTLEALRRRGFSDGMIEAFFRPFLGGVFLERDLATSDRMLAFVFGMFSSGDTALPAAGMQAIPDQLAAGLPPGTVRLGARVEAVEPGAVVLRGGERVPASAIVLAVEEREAARLLGQPPPPGGNGTVCLYFAAPEPPVAEPLLVLDGEGRGPVNHLCVPGRVARSYAAGREELVSCSVVGIPPETGPGLEQAVRLQMRGWFGSAVDRWRHVRTYVIPHALPSGLPGRRPWGAADPRVRPGLWVCGDHAEQGSIQGALVSGRRAAEALLSVS